MFKEVTFGSGFIPATEFTYEIGTDSLLDVQIDKTKIMFDGELDGCSSALDLIEVDDNGVIEPISKP